MRLDVGSVLSNPSLTWYLTRALGLVLLVVMTLSTVVGVLSTTSSAGGRVPRFVATDLHRRLSVIAVALLVGHIVVSIADSYVEITWVDAVVPFVGSYRPFWLGVGTLATDVVLLVTISSMLRGRLSPRLWRGLHLTVYAAWPLMVVHGLGTGSDSRSLPVVVLTVACSLAVLGAVGWRLVHLPGRLGRLRLVTLAALPVLALAVSVWAVKGPLAPGWSKKAGTPPPLTAPAAASSSSGVGSR
jgi:predicted ferric reductase